MSVALRRIGNGYPDWPARSLSCSGGAVATVSSPLPIDALGRMSDTRDRQRLNKGGEMLEDGAEAYGTDMQEQFAASRRSFCARRYKQEERHPARLFGLPR